MQFVVHWLNNKELHFTHEAEHVLEDISRSMTVTMSGLHDDDDTVTENGVDLPSEVKTNKGITQHFLFIIYLSSEMTADLTTQTVV